jgi:hypothetical protein
MTQARNFLRILELGPKTMRALFVHKSLLDDDDACKESIFASQKLSLRQQNLFLSSLRFEAIR